MAEPLVTVLVRNRNRRDRLQRALASIAAQTCRDYEILIVDDASTDGSAGWLEASRAKLPPFRLLRRGQAGGPAGAANAGIAAARGRYIAFLDSDDEWLPDFLLEHLAALERTPRAVMTYGDLVEVHEDLAIERLVAVPVSEDQRGAMLLGGLVHTQSSTLIRRDTFALAGGFDERFLIVQDYDYYLRLTLEFDQPFVHVARPLTRYYVSMDGITQQHDLWLREWLAALDTGFAHPAAAPYRERKLEAVRNVSLRVVARRKLNQWLARGAPRRVSVIAWGDARQAKSQFDAQDWADKELLVAAPGTGLAGALNRRIGEAGGDLIAFLDSADRWEPGYLSAQVRAHSFVRAEPAFSFCGAWQIAQSDPLAHLLLHPYPAGLSLMAAERSRILAAGGFDESLEGCEAFELALRLLAQAEPRAAHSPAHIARPLAALARPGIARPDQARLAVERFLADEAGRPYRALGARALAVLAA